MYAEYHRKQKQREANKRWKQSDLKYYAKVMREKTRRLNAQAKLEVLEYYGKGNKVKCCWRGCQVVDPDMLTLDHILNNGAGNRKGFRQGGLGMRKTLRRLNWPDTFQTLCWNHQWKKEIQHRRENRL